MRNDPPKISAIIPAYNQAQYLADAVQSALDQTFQDFEIIVVDDGSTDDTPRVASQFNTHIRYTRQENRGLAGARNTGVRLARGEWIALLDSDDQWLPSFLETMLSLADQHPEGMVFYCWASSMDEKGGDLPQLACKWLVSPQDMYTKLLRGNFLIPSTILLRRSVLEEKGVFDESFRSLEDWDLWLRIAKDHAFIGTDACLVRYRLHGSSLSTNPTGMQRAVMGVVNKHFGPDDDNWGTWDWEKRRAYGGAYLYHALTSLLRQKDWKLCTMYLRQALQADPTLAVNLDMFYELALGVQPPGYRCTPHQLDLRANEISIKNMLVDVFCSEALANSSSIKRLTFGTAYYGLGLVAYNTGHYALSRRYCITALRFRPELLVEKIFFMLFVKSLSGSRFLSLLRKFRRTPKHNLMEIV